MKIPFQYTHMHLLQDLSLRLTSKEITQMFSFENKTVQPQGDPRPEHHEAHPNNPKVTGASAGK